MPERLQPIISRLCLLQRNTHWSICNIQWHTGFQSLIATRRTLWHNPSTIDLWCAMLNRILPLLFGLILGLAAGLFYGWVIQPAEISEISPRSLRQDHRAEFILAIAEVYAMDGNLQSARQRIALLESDSTPNEDVAQTLDFAKEHEYGDLDLLLLGGLLNDLRSVSPPPESEAP